MSNPLMLCNSAVPLYSKLNNIKAFIYVSRIFS